MPKFDCSGLRYRLEYVGAVFCFLFYLLLMLIPLERCYFVLFGHDFIYHYHLVFSAMIKFIIVVIVLSSVLVPQFLRGR